MYIFIYIHKYMHTQREREIYIVTYIHFTILFGSLADQAEKNGNLRGRSALPSATRLGAPGVHIGQGPGERLNARGPCWRRRREMENDGKNEE
jgi:hypothetical protein